MLIEAAERVCPGIRASNDEQTRKILITQRTISCWAIYAQCVSNAQTSALVEKEVLSAPRERYGLLL